MRSISMCASLSLVMLAGCSKNPADTTATPAGAPPAAALQPQAAHDPMSQAGQTAQGKVLETMDAANYTYVRVKTASTEIWAASTTFKVAVGDEVVVPLDNPMQKFHSQTLNRDFDVIYFAPQITRPGAPGMAPAGSAPPPGAGATPETVVTTPIPPAAGGMTIANVVTNRKSLAGKTVTVRGKVVKFNGGIMGLNWIHIQDGSGSAKDGSNDLTVTSATGGANVGDVVTITGTVVIDKDFGAGYAYAVLLQNATVAVK
jgi:hypothetical protein